MTTSEEYVDIAKRGVQSRSVEAGPFLGRGDGWATSTRMSTSEHVRHVRANTASSCSETSVRRVATDGRRCLSVRRRTKEGECGLLVS
jgi:hypothetical protein